MFYRRFIWSFCILIIACPLYAAVYQDRDSENHIPAFSDQNAPTSTAIDVPPVQTYGAPSVATPAAPIETPLPTQPTYAVSIISPPTGSVLIPDEWLTISVQVTPALSDGAGLQLIQDGAPSGNPQGSPEFKIHWLDRGEHHFQVQVVDKNGAVLQESEAVIYFQRRVIAK